MSAIEQRLLEPLDHRLIALTQKGLPLVPRPYHELAQQLGVEAEEVERRLQALQERGVVRRIGLIPNHYKLGFRANGMSVWDVVDARVSELGAEVGALPFVSHCYRRPRHLPEWPYNLFAMVHGTSREEVEAHVGEIAALLGGHCRGSRVLYSKRILKKTGLRLRERREDHA